MVPRHLLGGGHEIGHHGRTISTALRCRENVTFDSLLGKTLDTAVSSTVLPRPRPTILDTRRPHSTNNLLRLFADKFAHFMVEIVEVIEGNQGGAAGLVKFDTKHEYQACWGTSREGAKAFRWYGCA